MSDGRCLRCGKPGATGTTHACISQEWTTTPRYTAMDEAEAEEHGTLSHAYGPEDMQGRADRCACGSELVSCHGCAGVRCLTCDPYSDYERLNRCCVVITDHLSGTRHQAGFKVSHGC